MVFPQHRTAIACLRFSADKVEAGGDTQPLGSPAVSLPFLLVQGSPEKGKGFRV